MRSLQLAQAGAVHVGRFGARHVHARTVAKLSRDRIEGSQNGLVVGIGGGLEDGFGATAAAPTGLRERREKEAIQLWIRDARPELAREFAVLVSFGTTALAHIGEGLVEVGG